MNPHAATSMPRPILRGADGSLPFLDNAPKMAMETGVKATTKNGLNCWKIGASTGTEPLSELYRYPKNASASKMTIPDIAFPFPVEDWNKENKP